MPLAQVHSLRPRPVVKKMPHRLGISAGRVTAEFSPPKHAYSETSLCLPIKRA